MTSDNHLFADLSNEPLPRTQLKRPLKLVLLGMPWPLGYDKILHHESGGAETRIILKAKEGAFFNFLKYTST